MDFIRDMDNLLMEMDSSSSSDEDEVEEEAYGRRPYRMYTRNTVDSYDEIDFRRYFRLKKSTFWHLHGSIGAQIEGDRGR